MNPICMSLVLGAASAAGVVAQSSNLPSSVHMGIFTIESDARRFTTVHGPSVIPGYPEARIKNMNRPEGLPRKFLVGDGTLFRAVIGVDFSPGTPLAVAINSAANRILQKQSRTRQPLLEASLEYLREFLSAQYIKPASKELPWDEKLPEVLSHVSRTDLKRAFELRLPVGAPPLESSAISPVVRLEKYLVKGEGYCLQATIFAHGVLRALGIKSRFVNGALVYFANGVDYNQGFRDGGHTWLQLEDGRMFDPFWESLQPPPVYNHPADPRLYWFNSPRESTYRFENTLYPMLVLEE